MNPEQARPQFQALISAQVADIKTANTYLLQIKQAIAENQLDQLNQLLTSPALPMESIEQREQQRQQLAQACGFSSESEGFRQCIEWCDDDSKSLGRIHQDLHEGLNRLQKALQLNSLLINKGQDRLRRSLGILTGLGSNGQYKTYSSQGKTQSTQGQRNIAIA